VVLAAVLQPVVLLAPGVQEASALVTDMPELLTVACFTTQTGSTFPPEAASDVRNGTGCGQTATAWTGPDPGSSYSMEITRSLVSGRYRVSNVFIKWNTSALPDDAEVTGAWFKLGVTAVSDANSYQVSGDWYQCGSTCGTSNYTSAPIAGAVSAPVSLIECCSGTTVNSFPLLDVASHISTTGTTGVRLALGGGTPTGPNTVSIDASVVPTLTVEYRLGGDGKELSRVDTLRVAGLRRPQFFDRHGAVRDSDMYAENPRTGAWAPIGGTDCTNFVSQAWFWGGGVNMNTWWFLRQSGGGREWSHAWAVARTFARYAVMDRKIAVWRYADVTQPFNAADRGDVILYDWGKGEGWSHVAIEVGWNANGDYINQHTADRYHSPWNRGYLHDLRFRPKYAPLNKAIIVHVVAP
jgi:cell wall-associated NlpC family hydrolase